MTPEARAAMRATLQQAVARARLPGVSLGYASGHAPMPQVPASAAALLDRFARELTALGGVVHEAQSPDDARAIVLSLVTRDASPKALTWEDVELPVPGVRDALVGTGVPVVHQTPADMRSIESRAELATCTVGITGGEAGLAETGSIVVVSGPGRGRLASLLPPVHIALLRRDALVASLPALLAARPELVTSGANFVCITGPSRTADIEHTLSRGVHGPREVHVVLI